MKVKWNVNLDDTKPLLKEEGNIKIEALYDIILTESGNPDYLAIDIYIEARSWFKPKKSVIKGNVTYSSKLDGYGWQIGYEYLAKKHRRSKDLIRTKLVLLEKLGLLTREFRTEYYHGKRFNNNMYLLVWKDTPYFYSEIGLEKSKAITPSNQALLSENPSTPILENKDNIYRIPNNREREEEPKGSNSSLSYNNLKRAREAEIFSISKTHFEKKTIEALQGITETPTLAYGSLDEPAKVQDSEEDKVQIESLASPTSFMQHQAADTKAMSQSTLPREEERIGLTALQGIPLLAKLLNSEAILDNPKEDIPMKEVIADHALEINESNKCKITLKPTSSKLWQELRENIMNSYDDETDRWDIKFIFNHIEVEENQEQRSLVLQGLSYVINDLKNQKKIHWKIFTSKFYELMPNYSFEFLITN